MIEKLKSKISLNIKGKNINRFIKKLRTKKIEILNIKYINKNEADIIIYKKYYAEILKIKSIYEITELDVFGLIKIKRNLKISKHILIIISIFFIIFLIFTHIIFNIEVIHSNKDIRKLILTELEKEGIKKYSFKKSYNKLNQIKEKILNKYPDKIEWLEIENSGTKYTVRVEERTIVQKEEDNTPRNIIAKKDGVLKKVIAEKGDIVKDMNDYVKKGDLIINGELIFNEEVKGKVKAEGKAFAEVFDELTGVLGLVYNRRTETLDSEIEALIEKRTEARKNKDFKTADEIRDKLKEMGIILEDTPQGVKWTRS